MSSLSYLIIVFKEKTWSAETVIKIPNKKVEGWALPEMPGGSLKNIFATLVNTVLVPLLCGFLPRISQSLCIVQRSWVPDVVSYEFYKWCTEVYLLFSFYTLYKFRCFDWLICTT